MENTSSNIIKWSGFYKTEEDAQNYLEKKLTIISVNKKIVSAKKELQCKRADNSLLYKLKEQQKTTAAQGMLLYKFTVVTAEK